ncbi:MAG: DUF2914 domain-containing protein [Gammaproteobacteria bacterium]|nr:DUF2914 domain-containing protein [Gammaproteobacteria bacterium]MBU2059259.1 DUF2914 domain-containing protein [Gammaproteobacteria bacterium]MBU2176797.1 DUF2914 domain-containing protein [Gammaproteobacteria bacterium]MBU2246626.1 DUF2914 domain-containing protein [Gammaproteobacteria bacterium]MBU2344394.1 DUF2914 domain-containing protein [Gammaproteobacteria bacterium]
MTTAQEKLVVRVSLGAAAAASGDLPEPAIEQQWHWRRISGAALTLCAAALLLYGWLHLDSADIEATPVAATAPVVMTSESIEVATPELVLEAVPQNPEPEQVKTEAAETGVVASATTTAEAAVVEHKSAAEQPVVAETDLVAVETAAPLFEADSGVLRLVLLTNEPPSAKARSLGEQIDATAAPQLALYSEIKGLNGQSIEHLWYYEGKLMTRVKLPVKLDYWRTYSRKEFDSSQKGEWRVEILDPQQNLLFSHHFHYH